ncbi:hypothetical protein [Shinella sp. HZN7]|uniref:hypothetical protein n=1 Tax=Shinella sp. (strain HZN7) TaxID=879274 RepID=UPI000A03FD4B|nr:hypothetical protein [Shinella sp. HZN7]
MMSDMLASGSPTATHSNRAGLNSPARVLFASLVGTTIEFFDFCSSPRIFGILTREIGIFEIPDAVSKNGFEDESKPL